MPAAPDTFADRLVLLERESELATLDGAVSRLHAGDGGLVVVEGSAGIGKTRLLSAVRSQHPKVGWAFAAGDELEHKLPFGVLRDLLAPRVGAADRGGRLEGLRVLSLTRSGCVVRCRWGPLSDR